jgi:HemY protein
LKRNPKLDWPVDALFDLQCRAGEWQGALETLDIARRQNLIEKPLAARRRAVLLTAQAQALEDEDADNACEKAREAHRLASDLIPAAAIAGRVLASRGNTPRAARVILKTWRVAPHPDLAAAYAYARPGDSPRDRLVRVRHLARLTPGHPEALIAVAVSAIEAREWEEARRVLQPLLESPEKQTQRVCTLMARIEGEQHGDTGRVREWLVRATNAPRDPAWVADGVVAERWAPLSPVTGTLDVMRWQVPGAATEPPSNLVARMEALAGLGPAAHTRADAPVMDSGARPVPAPPAIVAAAPVDETPKRAPGDAPPAVSPRARDASAEALPAVPSSPSGTRTAERDAPYRQRPEPAAEVARPERAKLEAKIFVPPRAPDDPGLGPDTDDLGPLAYPTTGAKA